MHCSDVIHSVVQKVSHYLGKLYARSINRIECVRDKNFFDIKYHQYKHSLLEIRDRAKREGTQLSIPVCGVSLGVGNFIPDSSKTPSVHAANRRGHAYAQWGAVFRLSSDVVAGAIAHPKYLAV